MSVTVVIPTIMTRKNYLIDAIQSIQNQTTQVNAIAVTVDIHKNGAWTNRNNGCRMVTTEWTAFLDDDDMFMPHHIEHLLHCAKENNADLVSSWFEVNGSTDPFPHMRGVVYEGMHQTTPIPIAYMVKTELLKNAIDIVGGFLPDDLGDWNAQDKPLLNAMICELGGKHFASPEITWVWRHHGLNTSGLPSRW